jgi:hypothetical protein
MLCLLCASVACSRHPALLYPADAYASQAGAGCRPAAEVKSLVAATAFDDFFRAKHAAESSGASL